jgi:hypothetical protein
MLIVWLAGACASVQPATPATGTSTPSADAGSSATPGLRDPDTAALVTDRYERALVDGRWQEAWDMLAPVDQVQRVTFGDYVYERKAYFQSVAGRYTLSAPTNDPAALATWTSNAEFVQGADLARAFIVQADYPALAGNNAGYEVLLVAPVADGAWRIWEVR